MKNLQSQETKSSELSNLRQSALETIKVLAEEPGESDFLDGKNGHKILRPLPLFEAFTNAELNTIYALGEVQRTSAASHIVIEGETTSGMYVILKGSVGVYKGSARSVSDHRVTTLSVFKSFGEMSLIDLRPRSATIVADEKTMLFYLDAAVWRDYIGNKPELALKFYKNCSAVLASRLRDLDDEFLESQKTLWRTVFKSA